MFLLHILTLFASSPVTSTKTYFGSLLQVKQSYLIAPHESHFQILLHILKEHIFQAPDYKVSFLWGSELELFCYAT